MLIEDYECTCCEYEYFFLMYEKHWFIKHLKKLLMNSTESKIGLLLEDAQTALERGVKRGAVKMDIHLEIR